MDMIGLGAKSKKIIYFYDIFQPWDNNALQKKIFASRWLFISFALVCK